MCLTKWELVVEKAGKTPQPVTDALPMADTDAFVRGAAVGSSTSVQPLHTVYCFLGRRDAVTSAHKNGMGPLLDMVACCTARRLGTFGARDGLMQPRTW